ncbi:DUF222 domain-containing protein [Pseudonocardia sp. NPDC046786]|uniref:DUF222 domain-containing protein n=1 Tax=Pseudonocardia sp. NPDC046786 TaxID=3155471 RepID=UPI0033F207B8
MVAQLPPPWSRHRHRKGSGRGRGRPDRGRAPRRRGREPAQKLVHHCKRSWSDARERDPEHPRIECMFDLTDPTEVVLDRPHWADREPPDIEPEFDSEFDPEFGPGFDPEFGPEFETEADPEFEPEADPDLAAHQPASGIPVIDPGAPPGSRLALHIEYAAAVAGQLTDTQLLEVVAATARHRSWLAALEHRMIAAYADRHPRDSHATRPGAATATPVEQWVPDELGLVLAISRERARGIIADAQRLTHVLPATLDALQTGLLDQSKVDTVLRATDVLDDDQAHQVETIVLARAAGATRRQIYDRLRRAVARIDPDGAERRHQRSLADRRIGLSNGEDAMATLWLTSSAHDTQASWRSLDRLARSLGTDDPRTLEQRRVDLAHQLLQGTLTTTDLGQVHAAVNSVLAAARTSLAPAGTSPAGDSLTSTETSPAGTSTAGGSLATTGSSLAGTSIADTSPAGCALSTARTSLATADTSAAVAAGTTTTGAAAVGAPAAAPATPIAPTAAAGGIPTAGTQVAPEVLAEAVIQALARKPDPNSTIGRTPLIQVVVALDTLIGTTDRPAELAGHGPIPATTARALAAGGVWQQLVTHPATGHIHNVGRTRYSPPAAMADHVRARDGHCRGPACDHPIRDLDHHIPWAHGGQTSEDNLHSYCRGCHTLKDRPGWQVLTHPDGSVEWISPHGWTSTSHPRDYRDLTDPYPAPDVVTASLQTPPAPTYPGRDRTPDGSTGSTVPGYDASEDPAPF